MSEELQVLFVDDEAAVRMAAVQFLELSGRKVRDFDDAEKALACIGPDFPGILVTDVKMPRMDGLELLRRVTELDADLPVVLLTGHGDVAMAVEAMRDGAYDFMEKPFVPERLNDSVGRALAGRRLVLENRALRRRLDGAQGIESRLMGCSRAMEALRREVLDLAATDVNVVIVGETGAGKDVAARCLHDFGARARNPYVAVNCAALPDSMFESEFFGHEAGAFTGALKRHAGKFEHAHRGTLFMDEIESMPLALQAKVLRAVQEKCVERLGSHQSVPADVRLIAASKVDLRDAVGQGGFRQDLYYRLNVAELRIPPLRDRRDDVPLLFEFYAAEAAQRHNRDPKPLAAADLAALTAYDWPGNVRELKNAAERHVLGLGGLRLGADRPAAASASEPPAHLPLAAQMAGFERRIIENALAACAGEVQAAMDMLDIPRRTLNEKMARYEIDRRRFIKS